MRRWFIKKLKLSLWWPGVHLNESHSHPTRLLIRFSDQLPTESQFEPIHWLQHWWAANRWSKLLWLGWMCWYQPSHHKCLSSHKSIIDSRGEVSLPNMTWWWPLYQESRTCPIRIHSKRPHDCESRFDEWLDTNASNEPQEWVHPLESMKMESMNRFELWFGR